jgi:hypothetical protein
MGAEDLDVEGRPGRSSEPPAQRSPSRMTGPALSRSSSPAGWEVSCGTRRHEARPGYVRLLKVWGDAGAEDPRLDPQALSELQGHPLPQRETLEVTLTAFRA